jgi:hypothetical protein
LPTPAAALVPPTLPLLQTPACLGVQRAKRRSFKLVAVAWPRP